MSDALFEAVREAQTLIGWAEFNLTKGKTQAALTLIQKAQAKLDELSRDA